MKRDNRNQSKNEVVNAQSAKALKDIEKAIRTGIKAGGHSACW